MADAQKGAVSSSGWWPSCRVTLDAINPTAKPSVRTYYLTAAPRQNIKVDYAADGTGRFYENDKAPLSFNITEIRSIELQSRKDFDGLNGESITETVRNSGDQTPDVFAKRLGVPFANLEPESNTFEICISLSILMGTFMFSMFAIHELILVMITKIYGGAITGSYGQPISAATDGSDRRIWWFQKGFSRAQVDSVDSSVAMVAFISAIIITAIVAFVMFKLARPRDRRFTYVPAIDLYCVHYLTNGERQIVGSVYANKGEAIRMHTAHVDAWQTAKLAQSTKVNRHDESEYL